ncbi:hypothetical protein ACFWN7_01970 [Agromyces sp. NPDC058484]|uniref:hypothetical protein n=1 Tax=Agromyces sp. NPDC058484 TaxID=3346524 RepID=UPI003657FC12
MTNIPDAGRQSAHVLLDAVVAWDPEGDGDANVAAMNLALQRINAVDGAVTGDYDEEREHLALDASNLLGGMIVSTNWLVHRLAEAHRSSPELVVSDLRRFLDD